MKDILVKSDPRELFVNGRAADIVTEIRAVVSPLVFDIGTAKGRAECASWAAKVARSKTLIDEVGKDMVSDWKAQAKKVDAQRKIVRDGLDKIKAEVRAPLSEYEAQKAAKEAAINAQITGIVVLGSTIDPATGDRISLSNLRQRLVLLEDIPEPDDWYDEQKARAVSEIDRSRNALQAAIIVGEKEEADAAEQERLRMEEYAKAEAAAKEAERKRIEEQKQAAVAAAVAAEKEKARIRREAAEREAERKKKAEIDAVIKAEREKTQRERHQAIQDGIAQQQLEALAKKHNEPLPPVVDLVAERNAAAGAAVEARSKNIKDGQNDTHESRLCDALAPFFREAAESVAAGHEFDGYPGIAAPLAAAIIDGKIKGVKFDRKSA